MNKSILIVICDFLLLTLLALVRFEDLDPNQPPQSPQTQTISDPTKPRGSAQRDLVDAMKLSFEEEKLLREKLAAELAQTKESVKGQSELVAEREKRLREFQESLQAKDAEARRLEMERLALQAKFLSTQSNIEKLKEELNTTSAEAKVSKERAAAIQAELKARERETQTMQSQLSDLQKSRELTEAEKRALASQLQQSEAEKRFARELLDRSETEKKLTREQLLAAETEKQKAREQLVVAETEKKLTREQLLAAENEKKAARDQLVAAETEKKLTREQLAAAENEKKAVREQLVAAETDKKSAREQMVVAETEKRLAREQLASAQGEVQVVRNEKAKLQEVTSELAQGVVKMSEKSGELAKEMRDNRPLAANIIFNDFIANRVQTVFHAVRSGLFGREINRNKQTKTVLVADGAKIFALYHLTDTPLTFEEVGIDWDSFTVSLSHGSSSSLQAPQISFLDLDPRIVVIPVNPAQARELGAKVYTLAKDPFKFQEAVIVGGAESYYGECRFQIDPQWPEFVKMERSLIGKLVGKFNPSSGDLVFAKSGELLGIMVNKEYCALLGKFAITANLKAGSDLSTQKTGYTLSQMYFRLGLMPAKLQ